ncbi:hypothetical protein CCP4SC76_4470003 [Gammaproteobacteria bacterium]
MSNKAVEFDGFKLQTGLNTFTTHTDQEHITWCCQTN